MNSARNVLSPAKENQLPSSRGSPMKLQKAQLSDILNYLKENGIKLPPHLASTKNPEDFTFKLNPVQSTSSKNISQIKSLKIKLSDTEFQLKKLQQDFAQYKRTVKAQKDKQQKKFQEALQRLKEDSKQNNEDYDFTLGKKMKQHQNQMEKTKNEFLHKMQKLQKELILKHSNQISKIQHKNATQRDNHQTQFNKKYSALQKEMTEQIERLKKDFQKQKHNINLRNNEKLQQAKKNYESTTLALQSQKKTQQKLHQKTKQDAQKEKEKLFGELCYEKNIKKNLQDQVSARNKEIKQLKEKIQQLKIEMQIIKENAEQEKNWITKQHQKEVQDIHQKYDQKIRKILQSQNLACQKYENKIERLNCLHQETEKIHESKLNDLSLKFDQRLSKIEDLQQIKKLTDTLLRKDEQIRKLTRELRYRNLQIQNKEEVYNKIFKSSTRMRQEKKIAVSINKCEYPIPKLERQSWSKQSLFRKSQTADVKILLQNISKTKRQRTLTKDQ